MPFDEEKDDTLDADLTKKTGLKKVSHQKSIFDNIPKKPSQESFDKKVKQIQDHNNDNKTKAAELALQFKKIVEDKTLPVNKSIFAKELEKEVLSKMIQLAIDINNDPYEQEGMGSLSWITLLFKICLSQRDRINKLEYSILNLEKLSSLDKK